MATAHHSVDLGMVEVVQTNQCLEFTIQTILHLVLAIHMLHQTVSNFPIDGRIVVRTLAVVLLNHVP